MNKILFLILAAALWLLTVAPACAQVTYSNLLTYTSVNNTTNNGSSCIIGTARVTAPNYSIQHGGLANTNALLNYIQVSVDNATWITVSTNRFAVTNAVIGAVALPTQRLTVYTRVVTVTTNNVNVGVTATFNTGLQ